MTILFRRTNLIGLRLPFTQRVECKIYFVFDLVDQSIFADVEEQKDFIKKLRLPVLIATDTKDIASFVKIPCPCAELNSDRWNTKRTLSL